MQSFLNNAGITGVGIFAIVIIIVIFLLIISPLLCYNELMKIRKIIEAIREERYKR